MVYGYLRVSTDKQFIENQKFEINNFALLNNIQIDMWISESISGTKSINKRKLGAVLKKVKKGDILICSEISRLGRTLFMIMDVLSECMKKGASIWTVKERYKLGDDISSKVLAFAFGLSAEIERKLISERTKEALARLKSEGKILGRPKGSKNKNFNKKIDYDLIAKLEKKGRTRQEISKKLGVHINTLYKYISLNKSQKY